MKSKVACRWLMLAGLLAGLSVPAMADEAKGVWLRQEGAARVKIATCGASLCGTIVWLKDTDGPGRIGTTRVLRHEAQRFQHLGRLGLQPQGRQYL